MTADRASRITFAMLLGGSLWLLGWSAVRHSPVLDEVAHVAAGLSYWKLGRFDLYRVNPPLSKLVTATPVALCDPKVDWRNYHPSPLSRSEFEVGRVFFGVNGANSFWLFSLARFAAFPFFILGAWSVWRWSNELYGPRSAIMAVALWAASPTVLGHGALATPDVPAASTAIFAGYFVWRWLHTGQSYDCIIAGAGLGLAALCKFTNIAVGAAVIGASFLAAAHTSSHPQSHRRTHYCLMAVVAWLVINSGYCWERVFEPLGSVSFVSQTFTGRTDAEQVELGNRFQDSWAAKIPIPFPRNFVLGIDVQRFDFERGMPSFLHGEWRRPGWWYYYLYAFFIKEPIGLLTLLVISCVSRSMRRDETLVAVPILTLIVLLSSQTGFTIHYRYFLPGLPFLHVWASRVLCEDVVSANLNINAISTTRSIIRKLQPFVCFGLTIFATISSLRVFPHQLSYFNEFVGGPTNGHRHLIDSNLDWGQDLLFLRDWFDRRGDVGRVRLAYFNLIDPSPCGIDWERPKGIAELGMQWPERGWYALSLNFLQGMAFQIGDRDGTLFWLDQPELQAFLFVEPVATIGYSTRVFYVDDDLATQLRNVLEANPKFSTKAENHGKVPSVAK